MKIKDCMCNNVIWATPETTVIDCAKTMRDWHIGSMPVCNENKNIVGFVTDRDILLRAVACDKNLNTTKLSDIMTTKVCCCQSNNDVENATTIMSDNQVRRLPVIENDKIVGILTLKDLVNNENVSSSTVATTFENICECNHRNAE